MSKVTQKRESEVMAFSSSRYTNTDVLIFMFCVHFMNDNTLANKILHLIIGLCDAMDFAVNTART